MSGGAAPSSVEDKPVRAIDSATSTTPIEISKGHDPEQVHPSAVIGIGVKPKAPPQKPRKAGKSAPAMEKGRILGKPPRLRPSPSVASLLPPLPDVLSMFMGCNTPDEFSSLLEYLQLNGGMVSLPCSKEGSLSVCCVPAGHRLPNGVHEHTLEASTGHGND